MAASKTTAVHISLIFFVMTTLLLALAFYMNMKEFAAVKLTAEAATKKASEAEGRQRALDDQIVLLKRKLGYPDFEQIGAENDTSNTTVLGKLNQDLSLYGAAQVQPSPANANVAATLQSLRSALNAATAAVDERNAELVNVQAEMTNERQNNQRRLAEVQNSQKSSETQLQELVAQKTEVVSEKDREIAKWQDEFRRSERDKESLQDEIAALRKQKDVESREYETSISYLRSKLNDLEDLSFDKPDGVIRRVDNTTRNVWINLGSADGLRPQVSFSVYTKGHNGVGRGNADIKAKIEVTRVLDPHLSQARILSEDGSRPIQENDPIYSPVWSKGMKEYFSFVGVLDMNGDDKSDRELLHNVLATAGGAVELEVDDAGNRVPENGQLTVRSKFLVVGRIEDPTDFPGTDTEKQEQIRKVAQENNELAKEAMRKGIKVISFRDFLNYIGYEQQQRLFNVDSKGYPLNAGRVPTGVDEYNEAGRIQIPGKSSRFNATGTPGQR